MIADPTAAHHGGNAESAAAYESIAEDAPRLRRAVLIWTQRRGWWGTTSDEAEQGLGLSHQTVSARITEAKRIGALVDSGRRRRTRSGRTAAVYVVPCYQPDGAP